MARVELLGCVAPGVAGTTDVVTATTSPVLPRTVVMVVPLPSWTVECVFLAGAA